jgi:hypothetical protein
MAVFFTAMDMPQQQANETRLFAGRQAGKRRRWTTGRIKFDSGVATNSEQRDPNLIS